MPTRQRPAPPLAFTQLEDRLVPAGSLSEQIIVDQIGWRADAPKVVVFADPQAGQNAAITYVPGGTFQVRRTSDDAVVFTGNVTQWNGGATHSPSGDRAWHGDFSAVTAPGEYYVYDPTNDRRSFAFRVQSDIYNDLLKTAGRVFYYQRSGFEKAPQFAGNWSHAASHLQERTAQRIIGTTPQGAGTARDVSGGWWDAGDYNKYVPFTTTVIWDLLSAYEWNPTVFSDAWNTPDSGNGRPDLLDEVKWELDWLRRMQLPDGSVLNRVGQTSYDVGPGPASDTQPHYYTGPTTWATASFAASAAHAAVVYAPFDAAYATTLRQAAQNAWGYLTNNPNMLPANGEDGGTLAAASASGNTGMDRRLRVLAAAELWRATGNTVYKTYFEANYKQSALSENGYHPLINNAFDTSLATDLNRALVTYVRTPEASATVVTEVRTALKNSLDWFILPNWQANDPYRGFMWDGHYTWGSNSLKAGWANLLTYARVVGVGTTAEQATYRNIAEEYLHYFHGRNPLSMTYLTNTGTKGGTGLGADKSPMEAYHGWWPDGSTLYDGANSTHGPTPGYLVGGPNQYFSKSWISPPYGMPPLKAFKDWNTAWNPVRQENENSWEITEPAIYYQAPYLLLVSQYATAAPVSPGTGNGLWATYYNNRDFTGTTVSRTDATVNFNWGNGSPSSLIGRDTFSARWTGQVQAIEGGTYTFRTQSDDGVRLWVNGVPLIDNWTDHGVTDNTGTISLAAGVKYDIRLEYYENTGGAVIRLQWMRPGQSSFATVPKAQLYSVGGAAGRSGGIAADWGGDGSDTTWKPGTGGTKRPWR